MSVPPEIKQALDAQTLELQKDENEQIQKIGSLLSRLERKKGTILNYHLKLLGFDYGIVYFRVLKQSEVIEITSSDEWKRSIESIQDKAKPLTKEEIYNFFRFKNRFLGLCVGDVKDGVFIPVGEDNLNEQDDYLFTTSMFDLLLERSGLSVKLQEELEEFFRKR